ncbi:MAG: NYN domain-containing protein, partial [Candidatus Omnitrophota bacterium]
PMVSLRDKIDSNINVVFTKTETADQYIKRLIEQKCNPKNTVVVSDDKEIRFFVRSCSGLVMTVEEFIQRRERLRLSSKEASPGSTLKPELTYTQVQKINQELRKIWLK